MIRDLISLYGLSYPRALVYMLQGSEYRSLPYLRWVWRTKDFTKVMNRRSLDLTRSAKLLLWVLRAGMLVEILAGLLLIYLGVYHHLSGGVPFGIAVIVAYPMLWAHLVIVPLELGRWFVTEPAKQRRIHDSETTFSEHEAIKIAVAGSYGKTTMKELLLTVLSEGKKVAATPANKNVSISHANFSKKLNGQEEVLIIEYGEGEPGDVSRFAKITHPTHAVITGLAPAHLDQYKTLQAAGEDIFSLADYVDAKQLYVNEDSPETEPYIKADYQKFSEHGALGWQVHDIEVSLEGTNFALTKGKRALNLHSGLIGWHQVGFLAFTAAFALQQGLSEQQVKDGIAKTTPFEHRMQPYSLGGAWIIDDTYNGNLEGIRAGTKLLKDLDARRKVYVTPGLVDQGEETERVHREMGELIAKAQPDQVILMNNSVTDFIKKGLKTGGFMGELSEESNPLEFYSNLSHFVASGDLVVMQNDWTDSYS